MPTLVLASDAVLQFRDGQSLLCSGRTREVLMATADSAVVAFVSRFAVPRDPRQAVAELPAQSQQAARQLVEQLVRGGVLVQAEQPPAPQGALMDRFALLARTVHEAAEDTQALGPGTLGPVLQLRVEGLLAAAEAVRADLAELHRRRVPAQLAELRKRVGDAPVRLHLGSGGHRLEGWINVDAPPADASFNVNRGLPFPDGSVLRIFAAHLLEHLSYPAQVQPFLAECRRVLGPGGRLRLVVPDIEQCLRAYVTGDTRFFEERRSQWPGWPAGRTPLEDFLAYAGAHGDPAAFLDHHQYGYDFATLESALRRAGFTTVERSAFMASAFEDLRVDASSAVAGATHGGERYSLFVEAAP